MARSGRHWTAPKPNRQGALGPTTSEDQHLRLRVLVCGGVAEPEGMFPGGHKPGRTDHTLSDHLQAIAPPGWVVMTCSSVEEAIAVLPEKSRPGKTAIQPKCVAVVELSRQERNGIDFVRRMRMAAPELPILVLSDTKGSLSLEALIAGASGHLYGPQSARQLLTALQCMVRGEVVLCKWSEKAIVQTLWAATPPGARHKLTPKQQVVMSGLLRGLLNKEIAAEMGITDGTVHSQLEEIYRKLEVHSRTEAVRKYLGMSGTSIVPNQRSS